MSDYRLIALLRKVVGILSNRALAFDVRCVRAINELNIALATMGADDSALFERDVKPFQIVDDNGGVEA